MAKYVAIQEESTYGTESAIGYKYLKLFDESLVTSREDFFPETTEYWTPSSKPEGFFRTRGTVNVPVESVVFPWVLVMGLGDPASTQQGGTAAYKHVFKFGANEVVGTTGIKPFTTKVGVGIEKDRRFLGCIIPKLSFEAVSREQVTCGIDMIGRGHETLETAVSPSYTAYTQPEFTFNSATVMTVGTVDRLITQPTIEAYRLDLERGWAEDYYPLGSRYVGLGIPSGMANVSGSMDFAFESEDEHERFLTAVGGSGTGDQTSFAVVLSLRGALISGAYYYQIDFTLPKTYYTVSTPSVKARDRIVQTCDFRCIYDSSSSCAAQIDATNITVTYV